MEKSFMIHAVLYEPEIPQNTGNIMRTCAAFQVQLHLIEPLGFYLDEAHLRRAGMDYRQIVKWKLWRDWEEFEQANPGHYYFTTRYGTKTPDQFDFTAEEDLYFVFGKESAGIPRDLLRSHLEDCIRIPMDREARCLNVSNTAAILLYEAVRQRGYAGLSFEDCFKPGFL